MRSPRALLTGQLRRRNLPRSPRALDSRGSLRSSPRSRCSLRCGACVAVLRRECSPFESARSPQSGCTSLTPPQPPAMLGLTPFGLRFSALARARRLALRAQPPARAGWTDRVRGPHQFTGRERVVRALAPEPARPGEGQGHPGRCLPGAWCTRRVRASEAVPWLASSSQRGLRSLRCRPPRLSGHQPCCRQWRGAGFTTDHDISGERAR